MFEVNRQCIYMGSDYKVIQVLDNDLLLVTLKKDLDEDNYPLQTYIIPDEEVIKTRSAMR